jgi:SAM-dependent methyltransferase
MVFVSPYVDDPGLGLHSELLPNYVNSIDSYIQGISIAGFLYLLSKIEHYWSATGHARKGHFFEVGCAAGYLLDAARARDWKVGGIDPSKAMVDWAHKYLQLPVECMFWESANIPDGSQDVVAAVEVIEHLRDPLRFLEWVYLKLKPGGVVFLTTPNVYSLKYCPPTPSTDILVPYEHLNLFGSTTLKGLLTRCNFQQVQIELDGPEEHQLQAFGLKH